MTKEVTLPSGAKLLITPSSFPVAKALYQSVLNEMKPVEINSDDEMATFMKDIYCHIFSSPEIEKRLFDCMKKATYNGKRIESVDDVFESVEARQDYLDVCYEVALENLLPFTKNLYAKYQAILVKMKDHFQA